LQLHLEQPILGMGEAEAESGIFIVLGRDQRDAVGVAFDPNFGLRPDQHDPTFCLGQRRAEIEVERAAKEHDHHRQAQPRPCPPPRQGGMG
jgi:hypothetical protein